MFLLYFPLLNYIKFHNILILDHIISENLFCICNLKPVFDLLRENAENDQS